MKHNVEYSSIKNNIAKCTRRLHKTSFSIDMDKLEKLSDEIGLIVVKTGMQSRDIAPTDIPFIQEYFKNDKLRWFDIDKKFTMLTFVQKDSADDRLVDLLNKINTNPMNDPDLDKVDVMADIVADYPCYFALVVSYESNNVNYIGKLAYAIACRGNKRVITQMNYEYNQDDMV